MRIEAVEEATPELQHSLARLLPQLNPNLPPPDLERLQRLVADPDVVLLLARDETTDQIVGTTTLIVYTTPFWIKARLDEVVVDKRARGQGAGEALVRAALDIARGRGAQIAELQSARIEEREAAHRLYERLGFELRDSDVFRTALK
jgi:GNAT superfamily N-acetyltransferase